MTIPKIAEVFIVFVPETELAKAGVPARRFLLPGHMPLPRVGEVITFGDPEEKFRVASRSFSFPSLTAGTEAEPAQVFYNIERSSS